MREIEFKELINLAQVYGHSRHWVERSIYNRLIPPAIETRGLGKNKGTRRVYSLKTYTGLHALCHLVQLGYRGNELNFALWYMRTAEWNEAIRGYLVSDVIRNPEQIKSNAYELIKQGYRDSKYGYTSESYITESQIIKKATEMWEKQSDEVITTLVPLVRYLEQTSPHPPESSANEYDIYSALYSTVITLLTPQTFIELIKDTTVHEFKLARILARGSWILSETIPKQFQEDIKKWYLRYEKDGWIKINRLLIRTYCNVCKSFMPKLTVHQKQRPLHNAFGCSALLT
jgi:hypothetical protein